MKLYFSILGVVLICVAAFYKSAGKNENGAAPASIKAIPVKETPPELQWPKLKGEFRNAVATGGLVSRKPSRIIEDVGKEIGKTERNIVIVDLKPEEIMTVVKWLHAHRKSRLIEPYRLRFFSSMEPTSTQSRKLLKPSWTVEFDCGMYGWISDGSGEEPIEIP